MLTALRVLLGGCASKQVVGVSDPAGEQSCHLLGIVPATHSPTAALSLTFSTASS